MSTLDEIRDTIRSLAAAKSGGAFQPYIDFIQFPNYRNVLSQARITFGFPLTVLVGQNGSGKTSVLHALDGAPAGRSVGNWWFGTGLDPIDPADSSAGRTALASSAKSAFWYGYTEDGKQHEVLKMRIRRRADPDYWEPSRPVAKHGMTLHEDKKRSPAIQMESVYLNFKTQLNAFDRCFYFGATYVLKRFSKTKLWTRLVATKPRSPRIQDYLRSRSARLRKVLFEGKTIQSGKHPMHGPPYSLSKQELEDVSRIIGREYSEGTLIDHRFYEMWGTSVLFKTKHRDYSEAFAGSGEAAVVRLVHEIHNSSKGRLILLDEPETSLHPGAQTELLRFLLRQALQKKLQIVLSTHSPTLVRPLPKDAIKVLTLDPDGHVCISQNVSSDEAFYVLGHPAEGRVVVWVEDILAKQVCDAVLAEVGRAFASRFEVRFRPGGDTAMKQVATVFMSMAGRNVLLLDGDKRPTAPLFDAHMVPLGSTAADLDAIIHDKFGHRIVFQENSNMTDGDKRALRIDYMKFCDTNVRYFSFMAPEQAIWNDQVARGILTAADPNHVEATMARLSATSDVKERCAQLADAVRPPGKATSATEVAAIHNLLLSRFCHEKGPAFTEIRDIFASL